MCEKRPRKILKRGSHATRLREARRQQRIQRMTPAPAGNDESPPQHIMVGINKAVQNKLILELAWKTVALMQKNKLIQQKIIALQKETSEFVAAIVNNPENRQRYMDYMREQQLLAQAQQNVNVDNKDNLPLKTEPTADEMRE